MSSTSVKSRGCFGNDLFQNNNDLEKYKALAKAETERADANAKEIAVLKDMLQSMKTGKTDKDSNAASKLENLTTERDTLSNKVEQLQQDLATAENLRVAAEEARVAAEAANARSGSQASDEGGALKESLKAAQADLAAVQAGRLTELALRNATASSVDAAAADELRKAQAQLEEVRKELAVEKSAKATAEASVAQMSAKLAAKEASGVEASSEAKLAAAEQMAKTAAATAAAAKAAEDAEAAKTAAAAAEAELVKKNTDLALLETGVLRVVVLSASGLRAGDRNGSSDPYAKVSLGAMPEVSHKTSVVAQSLEPRWNESFDFHGPLGQMATAPLEVHIFDQDAGGLSSTDLGAAQLSLAAVAPGGPKQLLSGAIAGDNAQGSVEVHASWAPLAEVLSCEVFLKPKGIKASKYDKHLLHLHKAESEAEGWVAYRASYLDGSEVLHAGTVVGMADEVKSRYELSIVTLEHGAWSVRFEKSALFFQYTELFSKMGTPDRPRSGSTNGGSPPRGLFGKRRSSGKLPVAK